MPNAADPTDRYTEDALVRDPAADLLDELGWTSLWAYNSETFGPDGLLGRTSDAEVVLTRSLRRKVEELNPGRPAEAYDDAVRQVVAAPPSQTLAALNRDKHGQLRKGVEVAYRDDAGELQKERLRLIDFAEPDNNEFLVVRELWVRGELYRRRADIIGFINGLPLLFIECKAPGKPLRDAYDGNFKDYLDTIPHLFRHNAVVLFANGEQARVGSLTSRWEHFHEWKRLAEREPGRVDTETALRGVCDRRNFLDLVENFVLFDESGGAAAGGAKKILARNHQFLGVNHAVEAVRNRKDRDGKLGVFWHTQGAGKSYSMAMFCRKVLRRLGGNFTFLILTDRDDLDRQIYNTFAGCGLVGDKETCRASSGAHLRELLGEQRPYIFSLVQKFNEEVDQANPYTTRDDVIVVTDEAHRTQYGTLALNMRTALPNASYIGFTGTPLFKEDEITQRVFGGYVSQYGFQRAVEDHATLPLYYDARGERLGIAADDLNERVAEKLAELEEQYADDPDLSARLEGELKRDYHVLTAESRLRQVAEDFVAHYSAAWESGKVMFVCLDKLTCVRMHGFATEAWDRQITKLEKELLRTTDEQEEAELRRRIAWMKETQIAVVVSEEQGEVEKFRNWDLDVRPHRKLLKKGFPLPTELRNRPEYRGKTRMDADDAFKEEDHPFRVAIVCAMWLTGFDVPSLSTLYLDKPLKAHTLMQAIARANRIHAGKNNGLIVDYVGVLKALRKALGTFAGETGDDEGGETDPARPDEELLEDLREAITLARGFLDERGQTLDAVIDARGFDRTAAIAACKEAANENDETRKRFEVLCREVFKKFRACVNVDGVLACKPDRDALDAVYKSLQKDREQADISHVIRELHAVVDGAVETQATCPAEESKLYDLSQIDFERLRQEFARSPRQQTVTQTLKQAVETRLQRLLRQNPLRTDFQQHYEDVVTAYNREKDRATIEKSFEALLKLHGALDEEEERAAREGLDEETLAIFDLLQKPTLTPQEIGRIKQVAVTLCEHLKADKLTVDHWTDKEGARDAVRQTIHDFLYSDRTGLPVESYEEAEVEELTVEVFRHVLRVYPRIPSPIYAKAAVA